MQGLFCLHMSFQSEKFGFSIQRGTDKYNLNKSILMSCQKCSSEMANNVHSDLSIPSGETCVDPESFVRGGPTQTSFIFS